MANSFIANRYHRLRNLETVQPSSFWMTECRCSHLAPLPVAALIKKHGMQLSYLRPSNLSRGSRASLMRDCRDSSD